VTLKAAESSPLIAIFGEPIGLRANMAWRIAPAGSSIVQYARHQALSKIPEVAS
jgi:hypothetical protein